MLNFVVFVFDDFSADELLLTELLFNGVFNSLTPEQAASLLSCFVFQENASEMPKLTDELSGLLRQMQVCCAVFLLYFPDYKLCFIT